MSEVLMTTMTSVMERPSRLAVYACRCHAPYRLLTIEAVYPGVDEEKARAYARQMAREFGEAFCVVDVSRSGVAVVRNRDDVSGVRFRVLPGPGPEGTEHELVPVLPEVRLDYDAVQRGTSVVLV